MFDDVDQTLEKLLEIEFGAAAVRSEFCRSGQELQVLSGDKTTLNCFLYDIRENREASQRRTANGTGGTATERLETLGGAIRLSYCITAWSPVPASGAVQPPLEEHRLLGQVLEKLFKHPLLPRETPTGTLAGQEVPLPTTILPEDMKANRDFWNALGGQLRPVLDYSRATSVHRRVA